MKVQINYAGSNIQQAIIFMYLSRDLAKYRMNKELEKKNHSNITAKRQRGKSSSESTTVSITTEQIKTKEKHSNALHDSIAVSF